MARFDIRVEPEDIYEYVHKALKSGIPIKKDAIASAGDFVVTVSTREDIIIFEALERYDVEDFSTVDLWICDETWPECDIRQQVEEIYDEYIYCEPSSTKFHTKSDEEDEDDEDDEEDDEEIRRFIMDDRESELYDATCELMEVFLGDGMSCYFAESELDNVITDLMEHISEYLYRKHGISIFRPMVLKDKDGEWIEDYPYEHIEYEDKNNPLYNK